MLLNGTAYGQSWVVMQQASHGTFTRHLPYLEFGLTFYAFTTE
jgi:hypothetical protein